MATEISTLRGATPRTERGTLRCCGIGHRAYYNTVGPAANGAPGAYSVTAFRSAFVARAESVLCRLIRGRRATCGTPALGCEWIPAEGGWAT